MSQIVTFDQNKNMFIVNITKISNSDFTYLINDLIRMIILQITIQFMFFTKNPDENPFFTFNFIETLIYITLGLSIYWLIIKRIVKIV